jgi:hypothetical protein
LVRAHEQLSELVVGWGKAGLQGRRFLEGFLPLLRGGLVQIEVRSGEIGRGLERQFEFLTRGGEIAGAPELLGACQTRLGGRWAGLGLLRQRRTGQYRAERPSREDDDQALTGRCEVSLLEPHESH